jgi:hypothetical protein
MRIHLGHICSGLAVRMSKKALLSRIRAVQNPGFFSFAAWDRQTDADSSQHDHSESLKNPLHTAQ